ncbi:MAG: heavy metal translocating P-type ATPase [candidate division WOR-3 bacterium]
MKVTDPVCGMRIEDKEAKGKLVYQGVTYYFCSECCREAFAEDPSSFIKKESPVGERAKDPICGMVIPKERSIKKEIGGRTYYFCSENCLRTFLSPEKEMKAMRTRVSIALTGVVALAIFRALFFLGLAAGATVLTWVPIKSLPWFNGGVWLFIITTPIIIFGGRGFFLGAYQGIKKRVANMDLLIALGTSTAYLYSALIVLFPKVLPVKEKNLYFEVAAIIIAFVLLGRYMEEIIKKRSSLAIRKLLDLKPQTARVIREGREIEIPAESVMVDEIVVVKPGEKIPTDGIIIEGNSTIDEKILTGESMPVEKGVGDEVIGGTLNKFGTFKFRATRVGSETTLAQIIKMVEEAQGTTAPIQRLADKVASYFVPAVIGIAFLSALIWLLKGNSTTALLSFVAVLIIACPCALGIATPAALLVGVGKGAEMGILIRGAEYLEKAEKLKTIVFDKTGTLTKGEPEVKEIVSFNQVSTREILKMAAIAEKGSEHPLAQAVIKKAKQEGIEIPEAEGFEAIPGYGVKVFLNGKEILAGNRKLMAEMGIALGEKEKIISDLEEKGNTVMILAKEKEIVGLVAVADTLKEFAKEAIDDLRREGLEIFLLTGDNERTAQAIASQVGIGKIIANVLPKDKAKVISDLQNAGKVVAMVGDGINDAPALAQADIGIAIGSGSDVAKEAGGIILVKDDLRDVVKAIRLSKKTMGKIKENLFWAFIYNTFAVPIAAFGLLNPIVAAAAMALSSLSVVTNSARLRWVKI